jgi:cobalt-zinc-cadmium efflux system outer membrane protein
LADAPGHPVLRVDHPMQMNLPLVGEFERALLDPNAATERVGRFEGMLLSEARRAAEAAEFAYRNGAIGVMDLLDARRTLRATQVDAAAARNEYAKALSAWRTGMAQAR